MSYYNNRHTPYDWAYGDSRFKSRSSNGSFKSYKGGNSVPLRSSSKNYEAPGGYNRNEETVKIDRSKKYAYLGTPESGHVSEPGKGDEDSNEATNNYTHQVTGVIGTNTQTGINTKDRKFDKLLMHADFTSQIEFFKKTDDQKNYKVIYDPETDKNLSKEDKKLATKKVRFNGGNLDSVADPRKHEGGNSIIYLSKPNKKSKKFPFKQLPQARFVYDKNSLGPMPETEVILWELPSVITEVYLNNFIVSFGDPIRSLKCLNDTEFGVPLGIATFKFQGNPEKAMRLAKKFINECKSNRIKIDGNEFKVALNDNASKLLKSRIEQASEKLRIAKRKMDEEETKRLRRKQELEDERKKQLEKSKLEKLNAQIKEANSVKKVIARNFIPNSTTLSIRHNNRVVPGAPIPGDLVVAVRDRPFIFINDKYVPTRNVSSQDIKKVLQKYNWVKIVPHRSGFFVIFKSVDECERCFCKEDGREFYEYKLFMEFSIPEKAQVPVKAGEQESSNSHDSNVISESDIVNDAMNILIRDFHEFLAKDIRERIIAPEILELLNHDRYPTLVKELKEKEDALKLSQLESLKAANESNQQKENALSLFSIKKESNFSLPNFRRNNLLMKSNVNSKLSTKRNRAHVPMQHALNYDNESEESEDEESTRSSTPVPSSKRDNFTALLDGQKTDIADVPRKKIKSSKLAQSFLYSSSDNESEDVELEEDVQEGAEKNDEMEIDYSNIDEIYLPTFEFSHPVFPDEVPDSEFTLDYLQAIVKDDEDFEIVEKLLEKVDPLQGLGNIDYWSWKEKEKAKNRAKANETDNLFDEEIDTQLQCATGSFKSEGYRKIEDSKKIAYLPHRKKIHKPIKTIQNEDEDQSNSHNQNSAANNKAMSSRVNRANNRRFAADINAQKQMLGSETDILNLNALTKRKKPVSFARSAIHNWGLYALEPISAKEMIIEYVGECIRQQVAEHREKSYLKTGIGSSYLFRIDENTVIDATKKGGIARFINHCCNPSCTAKIIKVEGKKRIVIYALRDIDANEELTYDYKFERETNDAERIRCLCGAPGCKGYLN